MHKRDSFHCEGELRLLNFNEAHYLALVPRGAAVPELQDFIYLDDWVLADVIEEIAIGPYANVTYEQQARQAVVALDARLADRVQLSVLHERRYQPGF
jgi:hypothetical protein